MTSVISMQENAGAAWNAVTFWEMSRMRWRYCMHRRRAAAASNSVETIFSTERIELATHRISGGPAPELAVVFAPQLPDLAETSLPADLGLPSEVVLDGTGVEPVAGILAKPIGRHFAQLLERHAKGFGA